MVLNYTKKFNNNVLEYEVDQSWRNNQNAEYLDYRKKFADLVKNKNLDAGQFPLCFEVESTYHCNLECPFCARGSGAGFRNIKHMSKEIWKRIIEEVEQHYLPSIMMSHEGEALLNPDLENMISDARKAGVIDIWMHTNGQALTPNRSRRLIEAGLTKLNVSIDATSEETYSIVRPGGSSLAKVVENIKTFLEIRRETGRPDIRVRVSFVQTEDNFHERESFYDFWKEKVNVISYQKMVEMQVFESDKMREEYIVKCKLNSVSISNFSCDHLWLIPVIDAEGNIIPCGMPVREHTKDFYLGNILDGDTISGAWTGKKMQSLRHAHRNNLASKFNMCHGCAYAQKNNPVTAPQLQSNG